MGIRTRHRVLIENVGTAFVEGQLVGVPPNGEIRGVRVTADAAEDADAALGGTAATDIQVEVREATGATGFGGNAGVVASGGVPLRYALTPADPDLTIDSEERRDYFIPTGLTTLFVAVALDADAGGLADATVVVVLIIEGHDNG